MKKMLPMLFFCLFCARAGAQAPETGHWQSLSYSSAEVNARQESDYYELIRELADQGQINRNPAMLARLRDILASLIPAATKLHPASADWEWEIHLTSSADIEAVCFAGGKILVSEHFLLQLQLSDGEIAALLAHEAAHALANHQHEELSEARFLRDAPGKELSLVAEQLRSDYRLQLKLSALSYQHEAEADQLGMQLALDSGWNPADLVRFYEKLARLPDRALLSLSVPLPSARLSMANGMAKYWASLPAPWHGSVAVRAMRIRHPDAVAMR